MANTTVNKVVLGNETLLDLTADTATAADVVEGKTFHLASGAAAVGTASIPEPSSTTPAMDGTAAVGTATTYARADHVHPTDTSRQAALVSGTNIKTINGNSLLGSGDLAVGGSVSMTEEEVDAAVNAAFSSMYIITYSMSNLSTDKRVAVEGETVTVTITSMSGYSEFRAHYDSGPSMVTLGSWSSVGTYTFTMPAGDVVITGTASGGSND